MKQPWTWVSWLVAVLVILSITRSLQLGVLLAIQKGKILVIEMT